MESINRGSAQYERHNLFELVRDIGGDKHMASKEVADTMEALRAGFCLYYEMYALLENMTEKTGAEISESERLLFLSSYAMFAAGSYTVYRLDLILEEEAHSIPRKEGYFNFNLRKDDVLNGVLARYYGVISNAKSRESIEHPSDLPRGSLDFFRFLCEEALNKKSDFHKELVDLVEHAEFRIADEFTISGYKASFEEKNRTRVEFVPLFPHQVAGNVLAKKEMLRDMDRIALYDIALQKNPLIEVGGLSWSVLYDGLPGTGKSSLFRMGLTRLNQRCNQVSEFAKLKNLSELRWKQLIVDQGIKDEFYGKTGKNLLAILDQAKKTDGIYIITTDDIDLLVSGDRNSSSGGGDRDVLNILMQFSDGINTVIRGNVQWWAATNDATAMDPALRQRFVSRYSVDGPREWHDYADILYDKLKNWIDLGIVDIDKGKGYEPYEARKGETGYETAGNTGGLFSGLKKNPTLRDIGELCREQKDREERFTGRAVHAVSEAIKKRINDYEIPEEWFEKPELFYNCEYMKRVDMLKELCRKVDGSVIAEEIMRYAESESRYSDDRFNSDVESSIYRYRVEKATAEKLRDEHD